MRKALIAANWKCHGSSAMVDEYAAVLEHSAKAETVVFPPAVFLARYAECAAQRSGCGARGTTKGKVVRQSSCICCQRWSVMGWGGGLGAKTGTKVQITQNRWFIGVKLTILVKTRRRGRGLSHTKSC